MKERRRDARLPVRLAVEMRRSSWERYLTQDISRRGLLIRSCKPFPVGQLMQARLSIPGNEAKMEVMARIARRIPAWSALNQDKWPGIGLEFFCLSDQVLRAWESFLEQANKLLRAAPDTNGYQLTDLLTSRGNNAALSGTRRPISLNNALNRSNLIFRAQSLDRLERFVQDELLNGAFRMQIPYRIATDTEVNLRVVHPLSEEEFLLSGFLSAEKLKGSYVIDFHQETRELLTPFKEFVSSGRVPSVQEALA